MIWNANPTLFKCSFNALVFSTLIFGTTINAAVPAEFSFSAVNSFEDRQNALLISGIEKDSGNLQTLLLYRHIANGGSNRILLHTVGNINSHRRCYDYLLKMLDEPGKFFLTLDLLLRDDANDFSRGSFDTIINCDISRQNPTQPVAD